MMYGWTKKLTSLRPVLEYNVAVLNIVKTACLLAKRRISLVSALIC
jgi:hypothetical protein